MYMQEPQGSRFARMGSSNTICQGLRLTTPFFLAPLPDLSTFRVARLVWRVWVLLDAISEAVLGYSDFGPAYYPCCQLNLLQTPGSLQDFLGSGAGVHTGFLGFSWGFLGTLLGLCPPRRAHRQGADGLPHFAMALV
jgi:hypothetical protein